jgi:Leucine-rich repeat (LRR) protein
MFSPEQTGEWCTDRQKGIVKSFDKRKYYNCLDRFATQYDENKQNTLDLSFLQLTELQDLSFFRVSMMIISYNYLKKIPDTYPIGLETFYCSNNFIEKLPVLPASVTHLDCSETNITEITILPPNLKVLNINGTGISKLPVLPNSLCKLAMSFTRITQLPEKLPPNLKRISVFELDYLYISKDVADRCKLNETPNYTKIFLVLIKINKSKRRFNKLLFCDKLQDQINEYRYRPYKDGYLELTNSNKNKWEDLVEIKESSEGKSP